MRVQFIQKTSNKKTGPIPITVTERKSCPEACPLAGKGGCYAEAGFHTRLNWDKVSDGTRGGTWEEFLQSVRDLPAGTLWRHNVAGDLPGENNEINPAMLYEIAKANEGKRGFTYTHYPATAKNTTYIAAANNLGFTVNLSANNLAQAIDYKRHGLPVVAIVPSDYPAATIMVQGHKVIVCPATYREDVTCASCKLCSVRDRDSIVAFPAHGAKTKTVDIIARG